jgi:hypothetical protein
MPRLIPQNTLIRLDGIQESNKALSSLKYFAKNSSNFCIVYAGSLVGGSLSKGDVCMIKYLMFLFVVASFFSSCGSEGRVIRQQVHLVGVRSTDVVGKIISWENRLDSEAVDGVVTSSKEVVVDLGSFGFIEFCNPFTNTRQAIFVHKDYLQDETLMIGDQVEFGIDTSAEPKHYGKPMAINVRRVLEEC